LFTAAAAAAAASDTHYAYSSDFKPTLPASRHRPLEVSDHCICGGEFQKGDILPFLRSAATMASQPSLAVALQQLLPPVCNSCAFNRKYHLFQFHLLRQTFRNALIMHQVKAQRRPAAAAALLQQVTQTFCESKP
jgi:hypothetical protein